MEEAMLHTVRSEPTNLEIIPQVGGTVSNISANFSLTSFILSWDKSEDPDLIKYLVLYKMDPNSGSYNGTGLSYTGDPGNTNSPITVLVGQLANPNEPSIQLDGVVMDIPYWFAVIAVNSNENESALVEMVNNITPTSYALANLTFAAPTGILMQQNRTDNSITFTWNSVE